MGARALARGRRGRGQGGLSVDELPLLVAVDPVELLLPAGVRLYVVGADDPELPRYQRVAAIAFAHPGGRVDVREAPMDTSAEAQARTAVLRERIATGRTVMMVAVEKGRPGGGLAPAGRRRRHGGQRGRRGRDPARLRARGLGAGMASALVAHARETADLVFLTAGDDDVARVYEQRLRRRVTSGAAELPDAGD